MDPKTESRVEYDDRRKVMVQYFKSTQEIKMDDEVVGKVVVDRQATFTEEGIRKLLKDLSQQQTKFEQTIKQIKDNLKDIVEITPALKELEENIQTINEFNKSKQGKSQLESQEADLKIVKKDIGDIKEAIGSRLKL